MRELTALELKAVSGGIMEKPRPQTQHPLLRLIVGILIRVLGGGPRPTPQPRAV